MKWLPFSLVRIDHVFYDSSWRAVRTFTSPLIGSDHLALVADLQWRDD
jgi:endonuclease/exonuclease/phosphatase (EEP) superfamily protein YafD